MGIQSGWEPGTHMHNLSNLDWANHLPACFWEVEGTWGNLYSFGETMQYIIQEITQAQE